METRETVAADGAWKQQWAQAVVMVALFSVPGLMCVHFAIVHDPDIWWHLRSAQWILQHGAVPRTEPFSAIGAGKPWAAYSWLYELMVYWLYSHLGLVGIVVYTAGMASAITMALFRMNRRLQTDFTLTVLLTFAGSLCLINLWTPRPWLCTILFFVVELDVLMEARKTGKTRELNWLPLLFALWANVHIQFVIGLLVLGMALGEEVLARFWSAVQTRISPIRLGVVFVACVLATLVNAYGLGIYRVVHEYATQPGVFDLISEFKAMPFRSPQDYGVLLFALGGVVVLARARRLELFEIVLLGYAIYVSFRSLRDVWVLVVVGSAIVASGLKGRDENRFVVTAMFAPFVAIATALVVFLSFRLQQVDNKLLAANVAAKMPVRAVEFVKDKGLTGPLFNDFGWGGYLIWDPGMPVSMDGRTNLYGDERINASVATWAGMPHWASDPDLLKANLVIGPVSAPLTQLLRMSPRFDLVYEDKVAVVFVAHKSASTVGASAGK
jgi:hypothetical protein